MIVCIQSSEEYGLSVTSCVQVSFSKLFAPTEIVRATLMKAVAGGTDQWGWRSVMVERSGSHATGEGSPISPSWSWNTKGMGSPVITTDTRKP